MKDYEKQATDFLTETKTGFSAEFKEHKKYFPDDKEARDVYEITLSREGKKPFVFSFGQSISKKRIAPTAYDVLSCLTKYDPGTLKNFCLEYGYDTDSRKAESIYINVMREYKEVLRLFGDVMEKLQEIN